MRECAQTLAAEMLPIETEFLLKVLGNHVMRGNYLEVGTAAGGTLCRMMASFDRVIRPKFVVVDTMRYFPDQLNVVRRNLSNHQIDPDTVDFRVASSMHALHHATLAGESFDFILIDANHALLPVMRDLKWTRLLNAGGIFCMHDYGVKHSGVRSALHKFLKRHCNYRIMNQAGSLIAVHKVSVSRSPEVDLNCLLHAGLRYYPSRIAFKIGKPFRKLSSGK